MEESPDFWTNAQKAAGILKEKSQMGLVLGPFKTTQAQVDDALTLIELCRETGELDAASRGEIHQAVLGAQGGLRSLELSKMLAGEQDPSDCYVQVNAGAGGTEACDWAGILARMYTRYANAQNFKVNVIDFTEGDGAGYRSVTFEINGPFAYGYLKAENGVHRLVRISPFDSAARRHTSFCSVWVTPIIDDNIVIEIRSEDLRVDTYRSSGAGGQHVNKVESAVRITHIPTNTIVACQAERSQIQNREKAMKMLRAKLYEQEMQKRQDAVDKLNSAKKAVAWGSQIRNYVMQPYQLCKDVRTGFSTNSIQKVLDGDLQGFIEAYLLAASGGGFLQPGAGDDDL
jgi:peptide chain release factor 2